MATRIGYRVAFAIGVTALAASFCLGFAEALRRSGRPPVLLFDPLVEAQRDFSGVDPERWIQEARSLTEIQPRNAGAFVALARALSEARRPGEAVEAYETALALGPVPPIAHAQLARLYYRRGDRGAARAQARLAQRRGVALSDDFLRAVGLAPQGRAAAAQRGEAERRADPQGRAAAAQRGEAERRADPQGRAAAAQRGEAERSAGPDGEG